MKVYTELAENPLWMFQTSTITTSQFSFKFLLFLLFTPLVWICIKNHIGGVFIMHLEDLLKKFIFDCEIRKLNIRTNKSYKNNNLSFLLQNIILHSLS